MSRELIAYGELLSGLVGISLGQYERIPAVAAMLISISSDDPDELDELLAGQRAQLDTPRREAIHWLEEAERVGFRTRAGAKALRQSFSSTISEMSILEALAAQKRISTPERQLIFSIAHAQIRAGAICQLTRDKKGHLHWIEKSYKTIRPLCTLENGRYSWESKWGDGDPGINDFVDLAVSLEKSLRSLRSTLKFKPVVTTEPARKREPEDQNEPWPPSGLFGAEGMGIDWGGT